MKWLVYFKFAGRTIKATVQASSREEARQKIRDRIEFLSIDLCTDDDTVVEHFKKILGWQ